MAMNVRIMAVLIFLNAFDAVAATGYHDEEYEDEDNAQNQD